MAHTYVCSPFNSTPFSSCCGIASMNASGAPDDHCHRCGQPMTHHESGLPPRKAGVCLMCGKPYKSGPQEEGACCC